MYKEKNLTTFWEIKKACFKLKIKVKFLIKHS